jgi:hypothetical protein
VHTLLCWCAPGGLVQEAALRARPGAVALPVPTAHQYNNVHEYPLRVLDEDPYFDVKAGRAEEAPKAEAKRKAIAAAVVEATQYRRELKMEEDACAPPVPV